MRVDKQALVTELLGLLEKERDVLVAAQRATSEGVTHDDARPESDKDTRATEASYLARGQAKRVAELSEDVARVRALTLRELAPDDAITVGAVVKTANADGDPAGSVFIAPAGGGASLGQGAATVRVITPKSPLGRALIAARAGEFVEVTRAGETTEIEIVEVC